MGSNLDDTPPTDDSDLNNDFKTTPSNPRASATTPSTAISSTPDIPDNGFITQRTHRINSLEDISASRECFPNRDQTSLISCSREASDFGHAAENLEAEQPPEEEGLTPGNQRTPTIGSQARLSPRAVTPDLRPLINESAGAGPAPPTESSGQVTDTLGPLSDDSQSVSTNDPRPKSGEARKPSTLDNSSRKRLRLSCKAEGSGALEWAVDLHIPRGAHITCVPNSGVVAVEELSPGTEAASSEETRVYCHTPYDLCDSPRFIVLAETPNKRRSENTDAASATESLLSSETRWTSDVAPNEGIRLEGVRNDAIRCCDGIRSTERPWGLESRRPKRSESFEPPKAEKLTRTSRRSTKSPLAQTSAYWPATKSRLHYTRDGEVPVCRMPMCRKSMYYYKNEDRWRCNLNRGGCGAVYRCVDRDVGPCAKCQKPIDPLDPEVCTPTCSCRYCQTHKAKVIPAICDSVEGQAMKREEVSRDNLKRDGLRREEIGCKEEIQDQGASSGENKRDQFNCHPDSVASLFSQKASTGLRPRTLERRDGFAHHSGIDLRKKGRRNTMIRSSSSSSQSSRSASPTKKVSANGVSGAIAADTILPRARTVATEAIPTV